MKYTHNRYIAPVATPLLPLGLEDFADALFSEAIMEALGDPLKIVFALMRGMKNCQNNATYGVTSTNPSHICAKTAMTKTALVATAI
jgi:hypothetical protein